MIRAILLVILFPLASGATTIQGKILSGDSAVPFAVITIGQTGMGASADINGTFRVTDVSPGTYVFKVQCIGYLTLSRSVVVRDVASQVINFELERDSKTLSEVVISGTMSEVEKSDSPIPVEVFTPKFFKRNPVASLFESVGMMNGVKPQLNCNVCNTGDIHINGMEGPYTMVLIDGMPIVSSLATVYGLMGIPNSLIERVEVVKGPASSLYGSEAMGGLINVITKNPFTAPRFGIDVWGTNWAEINSDISFSQPTGKRSYILTGINYYNYSLPMDKNGDNFTDVALQDRISVFTKWAGKDSSGNPYSLAARYIYEDRWGGQMHYTNEFRGGDSVYGESIFTNRIELLGLWQLPLREKINVSASYNFHDHNSAYGTTIFNAIQHTAFIQSTWAHQWDRHSFLAGASLRYMKYDDNTPATQITTSDGIITSPQNTSLPGVFVQDDIQITDAQRLLLGYRYDLHKVHGSIHSPRVAWKYSWGDFLALRASFGTGFRVVNVFTEDHAALTGARNVVMTEELNPERSLNGNLNITLRKYKESWFGGLDITGFYTYFSNKITADFDTDPDLIIYNNLNGYAVSTGVSVNGDVTFGSGLKIMGGVSYMHVFQVEQDSSGNEFTTQQIQAPKWSGTGSVSYTFRFGLTADVTASWYGSMRLPILPNDYRPEYSPWFCIANIQLTQKLSPRFELYGGVKNLLNFVPDNPIMRPYDPFDKNVNDPVANPNGYTFDASYNYAPQQGIRAFFGLRYTLAK
jgi:outer membrane receptor for ferrienterochelin and colicins